jgi:hypothetical protein
MQPGSNWWEFSREFFEKRLPRAILASKTRAASIAYKQIPCSTEQGIFLTEQGILSREQGISHWKQGIQLSDEYFDQTGPT